MSVTFQFTLNTPTGSQVAQYQIKCYESINGATGWTQIDEQLVSSLSTVAGITTYVCAPANAAYFHILSPVSSTGIEYPLAGQPIIPPVLTAPNIITLYVNASDFEGNVAAGIPFSVASIPHQTLFTAQNRILASVDSTTTNSSGYGALYILSDIGTVRITIGSKAFNFSTTGLGGTSVSVSSYLTGTTF